MICLKLSWNRRVLGWELAKQFTTSNKQSSLQRAALFLFREDVIKIFEQAIFLTHHSHNEQTAQGSHKFFLDKPAYMLERASWGVALEIFLLVSTMYSTARPLIAKSQAKFMAIDMTFPSRQTAAFPESLDFKGFFVGFSPSTVCRVVGLAWLLLASASQAKLLPSQGHLVIFTRMFKRIFN